MLLDIVASLVVFALVAGVVRGARLRSGRGRRWRKG